MRCRLLALLLAGALAPLAGSATAALTIDWAAVGNANNAADTPSTNCNAANCGSVDHAYYISKYEVTNAQYAEFLNWKAVSDPLGLYSPSMGSDATFGGITRSGVSGSYSYAAKPGFESKPVTYVSFYDSLRFSNWLNNGQGSGDTETGAYTLLGGTATPSNGTTVTRNGGANIFLPSENEWYKAAYYSAGGVYFDYPSGTNTQTVCAAPTATANRANCLSAGVTVVGAYTGSASPYGTYDQGGNVWEWNEQIESGSNRGFRGGSWNTIASDLAASLPTYGDPTYEGDLIGFRVASLGDADGDGLVDDAEIALGTNPLDSDSDDDGLSDGAEVNTHATNPLDSDSDDDGYSDGAEVTAGTNPSSGTSTPCGNGTLEGAEICDDGGTVAGDGCSAVCAIEPGYSCAGVPSSCSTTCGDAIVAGAEACDDGDLDAGDGCSGSCSVEAGWSCMASPSLCAPVCGDGFVTAPEQCDDGGTASGDGCSAACTVETVTIDWVAVGNPDNLADTPSTNCNAANCGSVDHAYRISKYEVTNAQYAEFLNAADAGGSNTLALYNASMGSNATFGGINFVSGNPSGSKYVVKPGFESKPVTYVSFYDALRFSNWLNNGQGIGDTETGAYTLLGGTATPSNGTSVARNGGANIFLPSENEWYKAAYHSAGGVYFDYPTGTNSVVGCVAPGSDTGNSANCFGAGSVLTNAGAYSLSASPYGTYDQGGNLWEWNEQVVSGSYRSFRGGSWNATANDLAASLPTYGDPTYEGDLVGFRVARLPEVAVPIDWVAVGNANNAADTPSTNCNAASCGSVDHAYYISKYEVTNAQYAEFLNWKAASDPLGLYSPSMGSDATFGGITRSGASGSYTYWAKVGFENKPVTYVSFYDSLRFSNWLNNGKGSGDTETGAYTLLGGTATPSNGTTVTRNGANIFLPSENEWYKAAYYDASGVYFDYPTGTNSVTDCVLTSLDSGNSANCSLALVVLAKVGAYGLSESPYGTYDQGGNVYEWNEQIVGGSTRGLRGGSWDSAPSALAATAPSNDGPTSEYNRLGFRVASLGPECGDGLDNDGDGLTDSPADPGCAGVSDLDEHAPTLLCDDGADNDGDALIDFPADPGCQTVSSTRENPRCDDDLDNDGDGKVDWDGGPSAGAPDPQCVAKPWRSGEAPSCGLGAGAGAADAAPEPRGEAETPRELAQHGIRLHSLRCGE